jgi:hypothetical protein
MNHDFDTTLDECLTLLRAGADWQTCLACYPQYAPELESLLKLISNVQAAVPPAPTAAARDAGQHRMLEALAQRRPRQPVFAWSLRAVRIIARLARVQHADLSVRKEVMKAGTCSDES